MTSNPDPTTLPDPRSLTDLRDRPLDSKAGNPAQATPPQATSAQTAPASSQTTLQTLVLDVGGMKCAGCVAAVEKRLLGQDGVQTASVNLVTGAATVAGSGDLDGIALAAMVTAAGFPTTLRSPDPPPPNDPTSLPTSANGTTTNSTATNSTAGATDATGSDRPNHSTRDRPASNRPASNRQASDRPASNRQAQDRQAQDRNRRDLAIAATLLAVSALGHWDHLGGPTLPILSTVEFHALLATLAIAIPGREILLDGLAGLWRRIPTMNSLIALGTLTAYGTSLVALFVPRLGWECFFDEPVMLLGFILLGRTLEARARSQARSSFEALLALKPAQARVLPRGDRPPASALELTAQNMPVEQVAIGQWLQVLPGDQIPVDGEVICGQTTVDESMLTGEALPVLKQPGDTVSAGTLVQSGAIALQATRVGQDTAIARIIRMVEDAQARKAPIQRLADTVAGYFTYGVMAIAALTFLFWYGFGVQAFPEVLTVGGDPAALHHQHLAFQNLAFAHAPWGHPATHPSVTALLLSLKLAIAVLVVACPCALGLATPTALLVGSSLGAERGLLLRGGDILERLHQVTTIVFDKTGTLTTGTPTVETVEVFPAVGTSPDLGANQPPDLTPETLLRWAAAVESGTQHPLAIAIRQAAHDLDLPPAHNFHTAPGLGASAVIAGDRIALGNLAWLAQLGVAIPATTPASSPSTAPDAAPDAAQTVVYVAQGDRLVGTIGVRDRLVPNASATVQQLQHMGLTVRVLTGDRPAAAQALAQDLGLDPAAVIADLRPEHKADYLQQWRDRGEVVAMVGDGINDAPALASADVGIAVGSATDVAVETAGIVLIRGQLGDLLDAIHLGRATFRKIRQNLAWAMTYNAIGIPIAAGVLLPSWGLLLSPAIAAAMMAFSSVSVVANSLLLRRVLTVSNLP